VLIDAGNIDHDRATQSIMLGYTWFLNNINPETGMIEYMYKPSRDAYDSTVNHYAFWRPRGQQRRR